MSYGAVFMVGIIASLSSCAAVVGGIVLSMSATFAKGGDRVRPQVLFHIGRVVSFFIFGGVIGAIGSAFTLSISATFILNLIIGLVMLVLGLNLLDIFDWTKKLHPAMPKFISKYTMKVSKFNHTFTPALVGIATFFLPCGFTQSMQIYTLSTGNFISGGLTMLAFALGTLPVLALISFGSSGIQNSPKSEIFFKIAGIIVIIFALFSLWHNFNLINWSPEIKNENISNVSYSNNVSIENGIQIIEIKAKGGYFPRKSVAKAGLPTILRFETESTFDCSSSVRIPSLNISKNLPISGQTDVELSNPMAGVLKGTCSMGMYPFEIDFQS